MFYIPSFFQQNKAFFSNSKCKNAPNINIYIIYILYMCVNMNNKVTPRDQIVVLCSNVEETRLDWHFLASVFFFFFFSCPINTVWH